MTYRQASETSENNDGNNNNNQSESHKKRSPYAAHIIGCNDHNTHRLTAPARTG